MDYNKVYQQQNLADIKKKICWLNISEELEKTLNFFPKATPTTKNYIQLSMFDAWIIQEAIERLEIEEQILIIGKYFLGYPPMKMAELSLIPSFRVVERQTRLATQKLKNQLKTLPVVA